MKLLTTSLLALLAGTAAFVPSPKAFVASNVGNGKILRLQDVNAEKAKHHNRV